jgi:hypothetical protein
MGFFEDLSEVAAKYGLQIVSHPECEILCPAERHSPVTVNGEVSPILSVVREIRRYKLRLEFEAECPDSIAVILDGRGNVLCHTDCRSEL